MWMEVWILIIAAFAAEQISAKDITQTPAILEHIIEPVFSQGQGRVVLSCNITYSSGKSLDMLSVAWQKDGFPLSLHKDGNHYMVTTHYTLIIYNPTYEDVGMYIARFEGKDLPYYYDCHVRFLAKPQVLDFSRHTNTAVGDALDLKCKVKGYPPPLITWYKDMQNITESLKNDSRLHLMPFNGNKNAHLLIRDVKLTDGGTYICHAYSDVFNVTSSKSVVIRVTDLLAAFWPFIGIVVEVFLFCVIIFLYERNDKKKFRTKSLQNNLDSFKIEQPEKKKRIRFSKY